MGAAQQMKQDCFAYLSLAAGKRSVQKKELYKRGPVTASLIWTQFSSLVLGKLSPGQFGTIHFSMAGPGVELSNLPWQEDRAKVSYTYM